MDRALGVVGSAGILGIGIILYRQTMRKLERASNPTGRQVSPPDLTTNPSENTRQGPIAPVIGRFGYLIPGLLPPRPFATVLQLSLLTVSSIAVFSSVNVWGRFLAVPAEYPVVEEAFPVVSSRFLLIAVLVLLAGYAWAAFLQSMTRTIPKNRAASFAESLAWYQRRTSFVGLGLISVEVFLASYTNFYKSRVVEGVVPDLPTIPEVTISITLLAFSVIGSADWWGPRALNVIRQLRMRDAPSLMSFMVTLILVCIALVMSAANLWVSGTSIVGISIAGRYVTFPTAQLPWLALVLAVGIFAFSDYQWLHSSISIQRWLARARLTVRQVGIPIVLSGWLIRMYSDNVYTFDTDSALPSPALFGLLEVVVLIGAMLMWRGRKEKGSRSTLGATLMGGVVVALAIFVLQFSTEAQRQRSVDRQTTQLTVASRQNLSHYPLSNQDLSGLYMHGKNLRGAQLVASNLDEADLSDADLSGANLTSAHLNDVSLAGSRLRETRLDGATVSGDVAGADLRKAYLCDTDLTGIIDPEKADFRGAAAIETAWPEGFVPKGLADEEESTRACAGE